MGSYVEKLDKSFVLREPAIRSAISALEFSPGSLGLDVGCGIGNITALLAESVAPKGHVTGVDISPKMIAYAEDAAEKAGLTKQLSFHQGDMKEIPFADDSFDWAWSMDLVGYAPMEPLPLIKELARVVKPGGCVAILAWSHETLLPGYPLLEARLRATSAGVAPFVKGMQPESHFPRALGWFRQAGLQECTARTFAGDAHAPLTDDYRSALESLFKMRWPGVKSELTPDDWAEYQRLCIPGSPDFILDHPDYYAFFTYTMFQGRVVENS